MPSLRAFCTFCWFFASIFVVHAQTELSPALQKPFVPANRWALVIGVSSYGPEIGALKYTSKEAREVAQTLTRELQFDPANVKLLADGGTPEEAPTSAHILASLDALLSNKRLDKANLFVFYFSGHGVGTPKGDFMLPVDAHPDRYEEMGVPVKEVIARIVGAGLKNVLFIADACRAGTKNDFGAELTDLCHKANLAVILGCSPGKRSYEYTELKHSAFTHFLLEGLAQPDLRDGSGTLWASKLGKEVQKDVFEYTERDHGKYAQVPALWGEDSTLDVLLATYPQPPITDASVQEFTKKASQLSKKAFAAALVSFAGEMLLNDRFDQAVELLKSVQHLEELTPESRYLLASSLYYLGRAGESERVFKSFLSEPDGYYRDLALMSSASRSVDPRLKVKAAFRIFDAEAAWNHKLFSLAVVDQWGSYDERLRMARLFEALPETSERKREFARGWLAEKQGRWRESVAAYDKALKSPGEIPSDFLLFFSQLQPLVALADTKRIEALMDRGIQIDALAGFSYLEKAQLAKLRGDTKSRIDFVRQALGRNLEPDQLWLAVKIAGPYIGGLHQEFRAAAEKHPYSWRARVVLHFVRRLTGDAVGADAEALTADRYVDDPLNFYASLFELLYGFMEEAVQIGTLQPTAYREQLDFYFLTLLEYVPSFGYDPDLWTQLTQYGLFNERTVQVNQLVAKHMRYKPEAAPKELRPLLMLLAMNRGDIATAHKIYNSAFEPTEKLDPTWFFAMLQATQNDSATAVKLTAGLGSPSEDLKTRVEAFKTYLLAKTGKAAEARKRLLKETDDVVINAWHGLAWAALGDWQKAEPLLVQQASTRVWALLFVQEYALRVLDERYRKTGRLNLARKLATAAMVSQPGNALFARYTYAAKPGVAQFAGSVALPGLAAADRFDNANGTIKFTVTATGALTGAFVEAGGKSHPLKGKVDAYGNITGTGDWNGSKFALSGKIAPAALYKTWEDFANPGQLLQLVDSDGYRIALIGRRKK